MSRYDGWIADWLTRHDPCGACAEATTEMQAAFPELKRVRGHYHDTVWGPREHWWLVAPDGSIVDPTISQFPGMRFDGAYEEWDGSRPEPTGKCMGCGEYCFDNRNFCGPTCEADVMQDFR